MPDQRDVAVLVGSLREGSWNRKAAEALATLAPSHLKFSFVDIAVSLYNQDLDTEKPPEDWKRLRGEIAPADAVLFATPEYNRSVPRGIEERDRYRLASVREGRAAGKASGGDGRLSGPDRRVRRQSSFATDDGLPRYADTRAAGDVSGTCRQIVQPKWRNTSARHARADDEICARVQRLDRTDVRTQQGVRARAVTKKKARLEAGPLVCIPTQRRKNLARRSGHDNARHHAVVIARLAEDGALIAECRSRRPLLRRDDLRRSRRARTSL